MHLTISKIYNCDGLAALRIIFEENIVGFKISMNKLVPLDVKVSLKNLPKDLHNFIIRESIRMFLEIIGKSSTL